MSQQGIYVLCYRTKLEKLTFNYCNSFIICKAFGFLKGRLKMHFLQVECKSSSIYKERSQTFSYKKRPNYVMGIGADAPMGSMGKALGQGSEDEASLKLITFSYFRD